jgi:hypothetical protein
VRRNPAHARPEARFSLAWVVVSYFLIAGGLCAAIAGFALSRATDPYAIAGALFVGAAVGGFLAGRGSPHRSYLEPALAALLVVGSVVAFVYSTPLGRVLVQQYRREVLTVSLELGGVGALGGLVGALLGEATQPGPHGEPRLGWIVQATFIAAGALFVSGTAAALTLLDEAAQAAMVQSWTGASGQPLVSEGRVAVAAAVCGGLTAFLGGLVTQMGAPRLALLPAALGAAVVVAGGVLAIGWAAGRAADLLGAAAVFGAMAAVVALVGASISYAIRRASGPLSRGPVSG